MIQEHPVTPPAELVKQWNDRWCNSPVAALLVATEAANWGADQELEACCEWLNREVGTGWGHGTKLRAARRPKPPSLKEQALGALYAIATGADDTREFHQDIETIKSALNLLDD